jgi:hypothetical protein
LIKGETDMADVEATIVKQLGGENHRCAFFRTVPYIRLRIAALYLANPTPHVAYFGDLSVSLTPTKDGPVVCVYCKYDPVYPDDFEAAAVAECGQCIAESWREAEAEKLHEAEACCQDETFSSQACSRQKRLRK